MKDDKRLKRRVRNSYIVSTVSMALVLFLLGSVGYLMTAAMRVARTLQESVTVTVELSNEADSARRSEIERRLRNFISLSAHSCHFLLKKFKNNGETAFLPI